MVLLACRCGLPVKWSLYSLCAWVPSSRSRCDAVPLPPVLAATSRYPIGGIITGILDTGTSTEQASPVAAGSLSYRFCLLEDRLGVRALDCAAGEASVVRSMEDLLARGVCAGELVLDRARTEFEGLYGTRKSCMYSTASVAGPSSPCSEVSSASLEDVWGSARTCTGSSKGFCPLEV